MFGHKKNFSKTVSSDRHEATVFMLLSEVYRGIPAGSYLALSFIVEGDIILDSCWIKDYINERYWETSSIREVSFNPETQLCSVKTRNSVITGKPETLADYKTFFEVISKFNMRQLNEALFKKEAAV